MSDLTPEALDRLTQLDADATPGPWFAWDRGVGWQVALDPDGRRMLPEGMRTDLAREADAALIAAMRTHLPALLDAARERERRTPEYDVVAGRWQRASDLAQAFQDERDAARAEVAALRERIEALDLSAMTEGSERIGTARWSQAERDAYSLAIEEAETAIRAALADPATDKEADA